MREERIYLKEHVGGELIADLVLASSTLLSAEHIKRFLKDFYNTFKNKINLRKDIFYEFPNGGITYIGVLSESHIGIHTYPEINLISFNIYFCHINEKLFKEMELFIIEWFKPLEKSTKIIKRGVLNAGEKKQFL